MKATSAKIELPEPETRGGKSLARALRKRRTTREFGDEPLSLQETSNLLWAACGVNRKKGPFGSTGITAASASNSQEIDLYVALKSGVHRFEPRRHRLVRISARDVRSLAINPGQRPLGTNAALQIIYVVDVDRLVHTRGFQEPGLHDPEIQKSYYFVDTGLIAGNVYLFAASNGLACWFHNCDRVKLAAALELGKMQRVLFAQTVGYAAEKSARGES